MQFSILVVFLNGFLPLKKGLNPTEGHLVIIILSEENNELGYKLGYWSCFQG